ncbi:hypothetical protein [Paraburkholderia sp.]|uniref:hypothetical protein n=1 Tax=Paraburkholderia sp. TaxID=1926495 RepID=UPI00239AB634|nr:hypothetical protein [Paraburkholderia sp.]MDE1184722.1 hypothetical protein [Paraburkholderia sp.]
MHENDQPDSRTAPSVFERVVPQNLLDFMNASIDDARDRWWPRDGRRASPTAHNFASLLRGLDAFDAAETQACQSARRWASTMLGKECGGEPICMLRCVDVGSPSQSYLRHFDSHILTLLIPLQLAASGERSGDLIMYRQPRRSVSAMSNVITKARLFLEHGMPVIARRALLMRDLERGLCERIACTPGNVYAFNGFVTMHGNLDVASGERRTLIIHYYDPGRTVGLRVITRTMRAFRDRLADL